MSKKTQRGKTNTHGVTAPVRPRKTTTIRNSDDQIKRLAKKHQTTLSYLANR